MGAVAVVCFRPWRGRCSGSGKRTGRGPGLNSPAVGSSPGPDRALLGSNRKPKPHCLSQTHCAVRCSQRTRIRRSSPRSPASCQDLAHRIPEGAVASTSTAPPTPPPHAQPPPPFQRLTAGPPGGWAAAAPRSGLGEATTKGSGPWPMGLGSGSGEGGEGDGKCKWVKRAPGRVLRAPMRAFSNGRRQKKRKAHTPTHTPPPHPHTYYTYTGGFLKDPWGRASSWLEKKVVAGALGGGGSGIIILKAP